MSVELEQAFKDCNQAIKDAVDEWYIALDREPELDRRWCTVVTS